MSKLGTQLADMVGGAWRAVSKPVYAVYDRILSALADFERDTRVKRPDPKLEERAEARRAAVPDGMRIYAVGDIHGRADLLKRLMVEIKADAANRQDGERAVVIFLGDYVDRGFQSKDVIDYLLSDQVGDLETIFLKGNHEAAFLNFLGDPAFGPEWARFGGAETLTSYGIRPPRSRTQLDEWTAACEKLNEKMPEAHRHFLATLEPYVTVGDYVFVHAGLRPGRPIHEQTEEDFLWIRESFLNDTAEFEQVVVHGHTPIAEPHRDNRRIGIDTGAYLSGKLTAVRLLGEEVSFVST